MKKQRRNGFTLIELLAVIIILGIVALIATPIILNVVENAQRKAFEQSAQGYYDAARYVHNDMMLNEEEQDTMFIFENGQQRSDNPSYILETQGEIPKKGLVYLTEDGEILVSIANDKWCATTNGDGTIELTDDSNACGYSPIECFTFSDFTLTDTMKEYMTDQDLGFEGMDDTLLQVDSFDSENLACRGIVIIPDEYEGRKVEGIKTNTFKDNKNITSVIFKSNMRIINSSAFSGASNLKKVVFNEELRYIGTNGFTGTNLKEVTIPSKVAYLGLLAFREAGLKKVTILNTMIKTPNYAGRTPFSNNNIEEVIIGPNVTKIPAYLFYQQQIKEITIPSSVTSIGSNAFRHNQIIRLNIPDGVTSIGNYAFDDNQISDLTIGTALNGVTNANAFANNSLTNVTIKEGVLEISSLVFKNYEIVNLSLPTTLKSIKAGAFWNNKITNLIIPSNVINIEGDSFAGNQLRNIDIQSNSVNIANAFWDNQLPDNQAFIYARKSDGTIDQTTIVSYGGAKRDNVVIPDGIVTIESLAFNNLTSITIPASVTTIAADAFKGNSFSNADAITILGDDPNRFDEIWESIGFPAK